MGKQKPMFSIHGDVRNIALVGDNAVKVATQEDVAYPNDVKAIPGLLHQQSPHGRMTVLTNDAEPDHGWRGGYEVLA